MTHNTQTQFQGQGGVPAITEQQAQQGSIGQAFGRVWKGRQWDDPRWDVPSEIPALKLLGGLTPAQAVGWFMIVMGIVGEIIVFGGKFAVSDFIYSWGVVTGNAVVFLGFILVGIALLAKLFNPSLAAVGWLLLFAQWGFLSFGGMFAGTSPSSATVPTVQHATVRAQTAVAPRAAGSAQYQAMFNCGARGTRCQVTRYGGTRNGTTTYFLSGQDEVTVVGFVGKDALVWKQGSGGNGQRYLASTQHLAQVN